ncbi:uncharacterized protein LOC129966480 [Argiope bruennichi]|uniref:uncharacterized protein LOC129966480 n=1 Tax=Argiope bruennichi TaxID=94029 RepID=UPI00249566A9|nr:uncharacterized protein LOC129966480 [Argiope bruennichi]
MSVQASTSLVNWRKRHHLKRLAEKCSDVEGVKNGTLANRYCLGRRPDHTKSCNLVTLVAKYEDIIEEVPTNEMNSYGNYLPHRAVIKLSSSTTPIRQVLDASARLANYPSLNQCLEFGPNLIELIPNILLRFREGQLGVIADIRKAFLQISIRKEDRDFLRFLWWENREEKKLRVFRHTRVVFGVKCSPFLLASVIEYHIQKCEGFEKSLKKRLLESFYIDNVVTSVDSKDQLDRFIDNSKTLMAKGGFDLREWEWSGDCETNSKEETQVLGLIWNKKLDTLKINMKWLDGINVEKVTKRSMFSTVHKVFDPFGFTAPVMLCPKIMLQKAWTLGTSWDEEVTGELRKEFLQWFQELKHLSDIQIPRCVQASSKDISNCTIHTFVDGSKDAYAAVTFLRIENNGRIELFLLAAKSRVAPLRGTTIPRMELLAAVIGARLANSVVEAFGWENVTIYYWSDSTTVLAWILREENWSVFVRNRVQEIRKLSNPTSWRHIPGDKNPADLPSRGCKAKHLVSLRWWEGQQWMKNAFEFQNIMGSTNHDWNEEEIRKEKSKTTFILSNNEACGVANWYYRYFSNYDRIVRLVAWILRFMNNCKNITEKKHENRVKDAAVFQVTGVDMAGPLFLKDKKSWVLIFTCAVYRAVHFELVTAASTDVFLMAFRRFVSSRGRCTTIYCDNGSNFVGAANYLKQLDWNRIQKY